MCKFAIYFTFKSIKMGKEITCINCGWHWNTANSEDFDKYVCHKCGFDNRTFYDSEPIGEHNLRVGGRTIAQTPSPKKDRIYGSKVNPKGSASSEKSASKIILSEKIIDSLKKKLSENNNDKVSLNDLKAVYRRGLGAYSSSHRPTISGGKPNSRNAWAMARVNKFLEKAAGKKVKAAYVQDDDLLKYEDGALVSENGKPKKEGYITKFENGYYWLIGEVDGEIENIDGDKRLYVVKDMAKRWGYKLITKDNFKNKYGNTYSNGGSIDSEKINKYHLGGDMSKHLAPNGKPSNLTHEQWHLVRTPEFKAWFGDWENDPKDASKVVDDNGEPKVYYQGQKYSEYPKGNYLFKKNNNGIFFTSNKKIALTYGVIKSVFINIRNPKDIRNYYGYDNKKISKSSRNDNKYWYKGSEVKEYLNSDPNAIKFYEDVIDKYGGDKVLQIDNTLEYTVNEYKNKQEIKDFLIQTSSKGFKFLNFKFRSSIWDLIAKYIKNSEYDGLLATDEDYLSEDIADSVVVYNSNQIKLADGSNTTFDSANPDIRYKAGGEVEDMTIEELNTEYIRLNKKYLKEQKIQRKFANEKDWVEHDKQIEVLDSINDRMIALSTILEIKEDEAKKNKSNRYDGGGLIYKKYYKRGGGGYTTIINGLEVTILKQYSDKTWIAQSMMGEIDIEKESLKEIKYYLENLDENFKIRYDGGGEVTDCKEYIMQNKSLFANGYFFDMHKLSEINDPYGQVPKNLDFTLIGIDIINSSLLADKLSHLCNLSKSQSYIVIQYFIDNAEILNDIKEIKTEKMVIVDRDKIVCENLSYADGGIIEDENGYLKYTIEGDELIIDNIKVYKQRLGTGKKLLKQIKDFARKNDLIVMLYAYPQDETITDDELKEFYISQGFELHPDDADGRLFTYANGGEITNPCIKEVIKIIYSIQKIKDCYIQDGKLVIVFVDELMVYGIGIINYHIGEFKECHDVIEPEAIVYDKEDYKSIYFNLKKNDATIGEYKEGGIIDFNKKMRNEYIPTWKEEYVTTERINEMVARNYLYAISEKYYEGVNEIEFANESKNPKNHFQLNMYIGNVILSTNPFIYVDDNHNVVLKRTKVEVLDNNWETIKSNLKLKEGGEVENKETYDKWKSLVNMSSSELERFYNSEEGKVAGLTSEQAKEQGIDSGRESARWILKMKDTKVSDWTPTMWKWANKQISFISRMSGVKGSLYDDKGNKTRKHIALLIWGNNPEKKNNGGEINNHKNTNNMESFKFNGLPHIDTISDNDLILIKEEVFVGDIDKPKHKGTRYVSCKVMSKGGMVDSLNLKVIKSVGANALTTGQMITRPIANLVSNGRKMVGSFKNGGEMPKEIESYFKEFAEINKKSNETTAIVNKISDKDERPMGLTSDRIRATQEYKEAKMQSDKAFQRLREFNSSEKGKAIQKYLRGFDRMEQMEIRKKYFSKGGELNPDNKEVKQYFAHDSGNAGGVLVGKRHSEGGIKATNNSTGQPIEMEGGEVVITRGAVSNPKKYSFDGKDMTTREVLSKLNVDGGGVSFAEGGDVPDKMKCGCNSMKLGGDTMSTQDFINMSENEYQDIRLKEGVQKEKKDHYSTLSKLNSGAITIDEAFREIAQKEMSLDSKYPFAE